MKANNGCQPWSDEAVKSVKLVERDVGSVHSGSGYRITHGLQKFWNGYRNQTNSVTSGGQSDRTISISCDLIGGGW